MLVPNKKAKKTWTPYLSGTAQRGRPVLLKVRLLRYLGVALVTVIVLIAALILINLHDRPLDPRAAEALLPAPVSAAAEANVLFALYGPGIPDGDDPQAFGQRYVDANNQRMLALDEGRPYDLSKLRAMDQQNQSVPWVGETKDLCAKDGQGRSNCLHDYATHWSAILQLARDNKLRLARYRALYLYPGYADRMLNRVATAYPDSRGPEHETVLGQIAIAAADGNPDAAAQDLVADTQFWRRVLAGASTINMKSVAADRLTGNYALASEIAARYKSRTSFAAILAPMTAALTPAEKDWKAAINGEFQRQAHRTLRIATTPVHWTLSGWRGTFEGLAVQALLKPNDNVNRRFRYYETLQSLSNVPAYRLIDQARALRRDFDTMVDIVHPDLIYNPYGKRLLVTGVPSPDTIARSIARTQNLDGMIRLLNLQLEIYAQKVTVKDIGAYVVKASGTLYEPYAYEPMHWDAESRELSFQGIDPHGKEELGRGIPIGVRL